jgi:hypothetical protein
MPPAAIFAPPPSGSLSTLPPYGALTLARQEDPAHLALRGSDGYPLTNLEFGRATEARFLHDALQRGLRVCCPFASGPGYDVVVDNGRQLLKVQVKGANPAYTKGSARPTYRVALWSHGRPGRPKFDRCAVYLAGENRWVFFDATVARRRTFLITVGGKHDRTGWEIFSPQR